MNSGKYTMDVSEDWLRSMAGAEDLCGSIAAENPKTAPGIDATHAARIRDRRQTARFWQLAVRIGEAMAEQPSLIERSLYEMHTRQRLPWPDISRRLGTSEASARKTYCRLLDRVGDVIYASAQDDEVIRRLFDDLVAGESVFE